MRQHPNPEPENKNKTKTYNFPDGNANKQQTNVFFFSPTKTKKKKKNMNINSGQTFKLFTIHIHMFYRKENILCVLQKFFFKNNFLLFFFVFSCLKVKAFNKENAFGKPSFLPSTNECSKKNGTNK